MERNREVRKASNSIVGSNGFNRRRHRTDDGGGVEMQESVRLRDRTKKDRDRERGLRERSSRSRRRRGERLISNRDDIGGDETSDESLNDDDYEDDEDAATARLIPAAVAVSSHSIHSSISQQYSSNNTNSVMSSNHHLQHRKSFPPASSSSSKVFRAAPIWKTDEIIGVSFPKKARSASTKRSHDWTSTSSNNYSGGGGGGGEQVHRQASTSPARQGGFSTSTPSPAAPASPPSSSNAAPFRKKVRTGGSNGGQKLKPPKAAAKPSSSNPEELEIEIAEVLFGLKTQSLIPSSKNEYVDRSNGDVKPHVSSPISNSNSANKQILGPNSTPLQPVASKRKRPRQMPENSSYSDSTKLDLDTKAKSEISSPNLEKISASNSESVSEIGGDSISQPPPEPTAVESVKMNLELKAAAGGLRETRDSAMKEDMGLPKDKKSAAMRNEDIICMDTTLTATASATMIKANALISDVENQEEQKLEIDLMAPPPQVRSSPEREIKIHLRATSTSADQKSSLSIGYTELKIDVLKDKVDEKRKISKEQTENVAAEANKGKWTVQESGSKKDIENKGSGAVDVQLDLEKPVRNATLNSSGNKLLLYNDKQQQQEKPFKANREELPAEKSSQSKSSLPLPLPVPMTSWPGGLPPMGYMAPLQGVVSMDGSAVAPAPIQPLFSQPRPKRCATHSYIARSIHCLQQVMKMNPFWQAAAGSASLFGPKPGNLNLMHADLHANMAGRGINNASDKGNDLASNPSHSGRDKGGSQTACTSDSGQRKQQVLIQQPLSPVPAANLIGPAFLFPLNQQQAAVAAAVSTRPNSAKSASVGGSAASPDPSASASAGPSASLANAMSFSYPAMGANETQYLAILQNNAYPFPIPAVGGAPPNYRGNPALFNGSFYSSQMIHPSQFQHQQTPSLQSSQLQQAHSNTSSSSQRHLLSQQQRPQSSANGGAGTVNSRNFLGPNGQNFLMPIHPHNFALMTPPNALAGASPASGSRNHNEKQQQQSLAQNGFAMTFGTMNGANAGPSIDVTSMAQNHASTQMMAAQKKHFRVSEDDKSSGAGDSVTNDAERKSSSAKAQGSSVGQSIAFSTSAVGAMSQLQQQHLASIAVNRSKVPGASSGSLFSEHMNSSSIVAATVPAGFAQNFINGSSSTSQSPQWRSSTRTPAAQASSSSGVSTMKNLSQQHSQMQTQISYGGNPRPSCSQGQAPPSSNRTPSPTTSSISRGGSGSPRTITSASTNTTMGQNPSLSAQTLKNSSSIPNQNQKSPSILGLPHATSSSSSGAKQQQPPPMTLQQAQLFFSNPHSHAQSAHLTSTNSGLGGFYVQRKRADQPGQHSSSSTGMLTSAMNDPAKAIAAATANAKGGGLPTNGGAILPANFPYPHPAEQKQPAG